ncbi:MAG TPA: helix-turn-helix domain-containing protein [Solirubrobacteraceae bacterium]|nr:helix-turn-helix domain-containing protein [Solirubrobacteraceae bacterium]
MAGLRERKKQATRTAIHDAAMRLYGEQGFAGTTVDQIAEAAGVSRATVFTYFATKEDIVFGDAPAAIAALADLLPGEAGTIATVRGWLGGLAGWIEPELVLQLRLAHEVPAVRARRLQTQGDIERVIADALEQEIGEPLAAQYAAAAMVAGLRTLEEVAADRMEREQEALDAEEIERLLDGAVRFAEAGIAALRRA